YLETGDRARAQAALTHTRRLLAPLAPDACVPDTDNLVVETLRHTIQMYLEGRHASQRRILAPRRSSSAALSNSQNCRYRPTRATKSRCLPAESAASATRSKRAACARCNGSQE